MRETSVWAYPWDLHDIGLDAALDNFAAQGVNTISLATSYHAGRFLQPGNPRRRIWYPQDGTVYYEVDPSRWTNAEIIPLQADIVSTEGDYLAQLIDRRATGGPKVSCWTVCLHNTRLGMAHPDHVVRTAHGDPQYYGLCPSSPAARAYVTGLVAEISDRYRPDRIELESPDFMGFEHGFHHEKDGLGLLDEDRFLLGICFCDHCLNRARQAGVPADAARDTVRRLLDASFSRDLPDAVFSGFPGNGLRAFSDHRDLSLYLRWRPEPVTSLIHEIRQAAHADTRVLLIDFEGSWWSGVDLPAIAPHCDGVVHCAYTTAVDRIGPALSSARDTLGPQKTIIAGFQMFHPEVSGRDDLRQRVRAAAPHADGINFYNLGLVPAARLGWIGHALRD